MSPRYQYLDLRRLPARVSTEEAAYRLGLETEHIAILIRSGLLKPLGYHTVISNAPKYFLSCELEELCADAKWLRSCQTALSKHWRTKNEKRRRNGAAGEGGGIHTISQSKTNGHIH